MRTAHEFWDILKSHQVTFFSGVPCSLLEGVIRVGLADPLVTYIPAVREDVALGIASAAHLTGRRGGILLQNSGLGNVVNPLTSFNLIYRIPVLMVVSWRGYGGKDAPEHLIMGEKTADLLQTLSIPFHVLEAETLEENLQWAVSTMEQQQVPVAVILRQAIIQ
ncbi:MAG TPA: thiamine pyrophosphate-binding protein [Candidatus Tectomicrobia bacterium]|nr:thiamine pyrophosphate-binding protein [Candidatus Tectomicrobia bacterium]